MYNNLSITESEKAAIRNLVQSTVQAVSERIAGLSAEDRSSIHFEVQDFLDDTVFEVVDLFWTLDTGTRASASNDPVTCLLTKKE